MRRYLLFCLFFSVILTGCAMGPDYVRPELELPVAKDAVYAQIAPFAAIEWWKLFNDPTLDRLELEALAYNRDLRMAIARVDEARALEGIAFAERLPAFWLGAGAERGRGTKEHRVPGESRTDDSFHLLGLASFELDLWGKYRRLDEAARAELLATEAARDAVRLSLTADVAAHYFRLRTLQAQTRIAREQLATYDTSCDIYRKRYRRGYTQELDLRRIEADRLATAALVYERENMLSQAETALAVLLGRSPQDIVKGWSEEGKKLEELNFFPEIPDNLPSDLLARRPDIRAAEGTLMAANARIGAARASFFPSISLTGDYGNISPDLQKLFSSGADVWTAEAVLSQPIFEGGRLLACEKAARARRDEMLAQYEKTVQNAFREARDALIAGAKTAQVLRSSLERAQAMRRSLELSQKQHARGYISVIDVLDVQRQSLRAELDLSAARQAQLDSVIALCRTLGGGWQEGRGFPGER